MVNSPCIADQLQKRCPNRSGPPVHGHARLEGGRPEAPQICPCGLCRAICEGLSAQLGADRKGQFLLIKLHGTKEEARDIKAQLQKDYEMVEENYDDELERA